MIALEIDCAQSVGHSCISLFGPALFPRVCHLVSGGDHGAAQGVARLYGPLLGVIPLALLFEILSANFPNLYSVLLGAVFIVIVYFVPQGVAGLAQSGWRALRPAEKRP